VQEIEQSRVELMNLSGAVVAQIAVQSRQGILIVAFAIAVNDIQSLSSMCVEEMQAVKIVRDDLSFWLDGTGNRSKENQRQQD
jgi:hypothetical protein